MRRENSSPIRTPTRFSKYGKEFESLYKALRSDEMQQLRADELTAMSFAWQENCD
jgi:hypothetical protein